MSEINPEPDHNSMTVGMNPELLELRDFWALFYMRDEMGIADVNPDQITIEMYCPTNVECQICYEPMHAHDHCRLENCGHCFHTTCMEQWVQDYSTCTICNEPIGGHQNSEDEN